MDGIDSPSSSPKRTGLIVGLVIGGVLVLAVAAVAVWYFFFRKKSPAGSTTTTGSGSGGTVSTCTTDASCTSGKYCISGACLTAPPACTTDAQCGTGTGRYCSTINNTCQNKCSADTDCTPLNALALCNTTSKRCILPTGTSCTTNTDCSSGQVCNNGTCSLPPVDEGQSCTNNPCLSGLTCYLNFCRRDCTTTADCTGGKICDNGLCLPPVLGDVNDACTITSDCLSTLICTNGGLCGQPVTSCTGSSDCEQGLVCNNNVCGASGGGLGSSCTGTGQSTCNVGYNCIDGSCQVPPTAGQDESCTSINCGGDLYCNQEGTCSYGTGVSNGNICDSSIDCNYGSYCNAAGTCVTGTPKPAGSSCNGYGGTDCNYSLQCLNNNSSLTCQATTAIPFCGGATPIKVTAQEGSTNVGWFYKMKFDTNEKQAFLACNNQPATQTGITRPMYAYQYSSSDGIYPQYDIVITSANASPIIGYTNITGSSTYKFWGYTSPGSVILSDGSVVPLVKLTSFLGDSDGTIGHVTLPIENSFTSPVGGLFYNTTTDIPLSDTYVVPRASYP